MMDFTTPKTACIIAEKKMITRKKCWHWKWNTLNAIMITLKANLQIKYLEYFRQSISFLPKYMEKYKDAMIIKEGCSRKEDVYEETEDFDTILE